MSYFQGLECHWLRSVYILDLLRNYKWQLHNAIISQSNQYIGGTFVFCLCQVARSQNSDRRVWRRASDYLGLMSEPAICLSVLGSSTRHVNDPGIVNWSEGGSKMIAHIPFYILNEQEGKYIYF